MKNVEYLNKQGHNSASECANQTYLKVMDMATQVESYFSDKRKAKVVTSNQDASEVSKVDKQALEKRIKENMFNISTLRRIFPRHASSSALYFCFNYSN